MKMQAVRFKREQDSQDEWGFAVVHEFGVSNIIAIVDYQGCLVPLPLWNYWLLSSAPGHLAEVIPD